MKRTDVPLKSLLIQKTDLFTLRVVRMSDVDFNKVKKFVGYIKRTIVIYCLVFQNKHKRMLLQRAQFFEAYGSKKRSDREKNTKTTTAEH